jgi:hypothetical protein
MSPSPLDRTICEVLLRSLVEANFLQRYDDAYTRA